MAKGRVEGKKEHPTQVSPEMPQKQQNSSSTPKTEDPPFADLHKKIQQQFQSFHENKKKPAKIGKSHAKEKPDTDVVKKFKQPDVRGKKRDNQGVVVERKKETTRKSEHLAHDDEAPIIAEEDALRNEILALGGTNEDLDLLADVESESEFEGGNPQKSMKSHNAPNDLGLQKGLSNIMKEIELAQGQRAASRGSSADTEGDNEIVDRPQAQLNGRASQSSITETMLDVKSLRSGRSDLRCEPRPDWFNVAGPKIDTTKNPKYTISAQSLEELQSYAQSLLDSENELFRKHQQSSSSHSFYNTVITSGTLSDKISALTLAVQESPIHNVKALETLVSLSKKRSRAQAVEVLRTLKDLFAQGSLLPSDRKLYSFSTQPTLLAAFGKVKLWNSGNELPKDVQEKHLISWVYESWLKEQYFEVLKTLEIWCNDEIEFSKSRAVSYVFELLKEKPEQESNLLRLLINKLGDPVKKIASQTSYLLMQLLAAHPAMKSTVVSAVETDFIFRPRQSLHAIYYAIVTLNQTTLSSHEGDVAVKLLKIYFGLFLGLLKPSEEAKTAVPDGGATRGQMRRQKKRSAKQGSSIPDSQDGELREKLISAILAGINRAYPYTDKDGQNLATHLDTLFKITHSSNFNTSIQAMMLIQQLSPSHQASSDRFYRTLYESLLDARLVTSSKQQLYLNLLHRALKADLNLKRVKAFAKRILQTFSLHEPPFICGAFFLLQDLQKTFPSLNALMDQAEDHDLEEEIFRDVEDEYTSRDASASKSNEAIVSSTVYNGRKRDPEHSNAENSCAWEILPFLAHFHPSVSVSADHLLDHANLPGRPDLTLHTLMHFLDRFVYRNPKLASSNLRGSSIMQPMASDDTHAVLISSATIGTQNMPVNTEEFRVRKDDQIAAEDVFFHKYFNSLGQEPAKKTKKRKSLDADGDGSVGDEEDEIWKAMMESAKDLEGDEDDSDQGLEMSDLDSEFEDEMAETNDEESGSESEGVLLDMDMSDAGAEDDIFDGSEEDKDDVADGLDQIDWDEEMDDEPVIGQAEPKKVEKDKDGQKVANRKDAAAASREKRKKMKALPTFAAASDYAKLLDNDEDEDLGR